jgi:hypothetical protein
MQFFNPVRFWLLLGCLTLALVLSLKEAGAEPVTTIRSNGDAFNRVDIAILGDGYTSAELGKYASDVESFVQGIFAQEPLKEYQRYFNVRRVDVTSNQSGADHPERNPPVFKDTALDATYNCFAIQRLICVTLSKVNDVLARSLSPERRDVVFVIVNDTEYGGSGGSIAVASILPEVVELILHEAGHSFGLLADEYGGPPPPQCNASLEPPEPNVTKQTVRDNIKWKLWIDPATPIPTGGTAPGAPGLYQGGRYCDSGLYRPTYNSKMRTLGPPFEQINSEQLVKRIHNWVSPIDSVDPSGNLVALQPGQNQAFTVQVPQPLTHSVEASWRLNGQTIGTGNQLLLSAASITPGVHTLQVSVNDPTAFVRNDPAGLLTESQSWQITVTAAPVLAAALLPSSRSVQVGISATVFATILNFGSTPATSCSISPITAVSASFVFQTTDPATNQVTGTANMPVDIPAGTGQSFVLAFTPTAPIAQTDIWFSFDCTNSDPAPINSGLNTLLFSASATPVPDIVALAATVTGDGIVNIPGTTGTGAFAVATVNVGAGGNITASADTGGAVLPVSLSLCQTNPATGQCISAIGPSVTTQINAGATPTFGIFVIGTGNVPFDPALNRVFVRFKDAGGVTRGSTSVAVRTQ